MEKLTLEDMLNQMTEEELQEVITAACQLNDEIADDAIDEIDEAEAERIFATSGVDGSFSDEELTTFAHEVIEKLQLGFDAEDNAKCELVKYALTNDEPEFYVIEINASIDGYDVHKAFPIQMYYRYVKPGVKTIDDVAIHFIRETLMEATEMADKNSSN